MSASILDLSVIAAYLLLMVIVGIVMSRMNRNEGDYFKSGCRGTWWLVGASNFMAGFSAWTFTGGAGAVYEAGPPMILMGLIGVLGSFVITVPFMASRFRQLRATTMPEVIRSRFGPGTQQFYAWVNMLTRLLYAAIHLYGFAIFASAVLRLDIRLIIVLVGLTVLLYATFGGNMAVMSVDFLQSLIVMSITILVAVLCLVHVGGIGGLLAQIRAQGLQEHFSLFKPDGAFPGNNYTWTWVLAMGIYTLMTQANLAASPQFFSCKDGREARRAALLVGCLALLSQIVFYVPPVVARLVAAPEVMASRFLDKPAESAYAVISMKLLPQGLGAMIVVAMLASTLSSMDVGLNRNAAILTEDIYPTFCRLLKRRPAEGAGRMKLGRFFTAILGVAIVALALRFALASGKQGIFGVMLSVNALLTVPLMIPMVLCLFVRRVPRWTAIASAAVAMIPSLIGFWSKALFGQDWSFQQKFFIIAPVGMASFFFCRHFWQGESEQYRRQVDDFFTKMHTPVDFAREVGGDTDLSQLRTVGIFSIIVGLFIALLVFLPPDWTGRIQVLCVAGSICLVGTLMVFAPRLQSPRARRIVVAPPVETAPAPAPVER